MAEFNEEAFFRKIKAVILLAFLFLLVGIVLHVTAFSLEFGKFAPLLDDYYGQHSKAERDSAAAGSELALEQAEITKFPPKLMTFKLVGMGSILTGIFLLLFIIIQALKIMPIRLGSIICPKCGKKMTLSEAMKHKD